MSSSKSDQQGSLLLIVDDEPLVRKLLSNILVINTPHQVDIAVNGKDALEKWQEAFSSGQPYDLMIVDLQMPQMNGTTLVQELRKIDRDIAIIILTGYGDLTDAYTLLDQHQISDFIYKPIHPQEILLFSVRNALEKRRLQYQLNQFNQKLEERVKKYTIQLNSELEVQREIADSLIRNTLKLKQAEKKLQEFQHLVNHSNDALFIVDPETSQFLEVNQKACSNLGYTREELLELKINDIHLATDHVVWEERVQAIKKMGSLSINRIHKRKDGTSFPVEISTKFVTWEQQSYIVSIARDITERIQAEEEKTHLERQLQQVQKMEMLGTLAGGIAHEFNNLLVPIIGFTSRVQTTLNPEGKEADYLSRAIKAAQHAKDLVSQILVFSRKTEYQPHPLQLETIVLDVLRLIRETFPSSIHIREKFADPIFSIMADPGQVHQVIMNLLTNARDAMPNGGELGIALKNTVLEGFLNSNGEKITGTYVCLSVQDKGEGMDEATLRQVFVPFFTTKEIGKGTGLGLSSILGIVEQHQGFIEIESQPGQGSNFDIYWPVAEKKEEPIVTASLPVPGGNESILLIDDDPDVGEVGKLMLEDAGYRVTVLQSSLQAIEVFKTQFSIFDLVITDYTMPEMVGTTLAQKLKAIRADIPIILCTGYNEAITRENLDQWGIEALINKPYGEELYHIVHQTLDKAVA